MNQDWKAIVIDTCINDIDIQDTIICLKEAGYYVEYDTVVDMYKLINDSIAENGFDDCIETVPVH